MGKNIALGRSSLGGSYRIRSAEIEDEDDDEYEYELTN